MNEGIDYWPGTGIVKSRNNGFTQGLRRSDDEWRSITAAAALKAASASQVERSRRDLGVDPGAFYGISKKSDEAIRHGGAFTRARARTKPKVETKASRMRAYLATGPKDADELGRLLGVPRKHARAALEYDVEHGRVVVLSDSKPVRYALPEHA